MFVGHTAVALIAKARVPRESLGTFVAAAFGLDLLWPAFLLAGIEHVRIEPGNTRFTPLAFDDYPWSHSLLMAIVWGALAAMLIRWRKGDARPQGLVMLLVVSHWVLDFVSHRPDMPLWPGNSSRFGLGLWNSVAATLLLEGAFFALGLVMYLRVSRATSLAGSVGFWLFVAVSVALWAGGPWSPPPPGARFLAWFSIGTWLFPVWAWWMDRHRRVRTTP